MSKDIYLVVGGSGLLGNHIVQKLVARGENVSVFDIVIRDRHGGVQYYQGDINEEGDILDALKQASLYLRDSIDYIFDLFSFQRVLQLVSSILRLLMPLPQPRKTYTK
jgi:nucleoside-diphosphate-sugar epimerase